MANEYQTHNRPNIVGWLSDNQALPNATAADSTAMVEIGGQTNGNLMLSIFANTAISIATGQAFNIELQAFTADTAASADSFYSEDNLGGINQATGTVNAEAHHYILHKTSGDAQLDFAAGDLIWECALPDNMLRLISYDFVQLVYTTDADESSETVDAFIWAKV
jgi:hypothetical protein